MLISYSQKDPTHTWSFVELHDLCVSYNGVSRRNLLKLVYRFGPDLLVLSSVCVASIIVFNSKAAGHLKLVGNGDEDDVDIAFMDVAKKVITESRQLKHDQTKYDIRISLQDAIAFSVPQPHVSHITKLESTL